MTTLRLGSLGPTVGDLHQRLIEAGEQVDQDELKRAFFGESTKAAVVDFQQSHLDARGKPLVADGLVGPVTLAALANPRAPVEILIMNSWRGEPSKAPNAEAMMATAAAISEIGVREDPRTPNRGQMVDTYNGPNWLGAPWCANFVSWCWNRTTSGSPFGQKASALKIRDWAAQNSKILPVSEPVLPGDIGVIVRAGGRGHVEIVCGCEFDGKLSLVGGNVGNAVRGTVRERSAFSHFVRPR